MKECSLFPYRLEIFGKDRAMGEVAEDVSDAAQTMRAKYNYNVTEGVAENEWSQPNFVNWDDDNNPMSKQPVYVDDTENNSAHNKEQFQPLATTSRKRKNRGESSEPSMCHT